MRSCSAALLLSLLIPTTAPAADDPRLQEVSATAQRFATAFEKKNWPGALDETHPNVLQLSGGRENAEKQMSEVMRKVFAQGMRLQALKLGKPLLIQQEGGWLVTFVPAMTIMTNSEARITINSYLLALKGPEDKRWYVVDGAMITPEILARIAPELEDKISLPPRRAPKVERLQPATGGQPTR